jgi:hypothetical protein
MGLSKKSNDRKNAWSSSYLYSKGLPKKSDGAAGSGSNELNMTTKKAWSSSYCYSMGLPKKSDGAAGSGSGEPSMTTDNRRGILLIIILWGYLRKATAWQVVAQISQV